MIHPSRNIVKALLLAGVLALALGALGANPALAERQTQCWKTLINDWYDGRIDAVYPIHCYREALDHLPTDVDTYSSARDDIKQALQERITQGAKGGGTTTIGGSSNGGGSSSGGSSTGGGGKTGGGTPSGSGKTGGGKTASGPIGDVFNAGRPGKADSLPIPLIVLGGIAILLMAAGGAGFLARRQRTRRLQLASAATLPQHPAEPPSGRR